MSRIRRVIPGVDPKLLIKDAAKLLPEPSRRLFLRGAASRRGAESIKPRLADHLGIAETRVTKYLADHCVVRYLQLDEGASHFAHFVTAVLRPTLNE